MSDVSFQQLSTVQSNLQPVPPTIPSAVTISPYTRLTFVTGQISIATINPFTTGFHEIVLIFTNAAPVAFTPSSSSGNIKTAFQPVTNVPVICMYDPSTQLWWIK